MVENGLAVARGGSNPAEVVAGWVEGGLNEGHWPELSLGLGVGAASITEFPEACRRERKAAPGGSAIGSDIHSGGRGSATPRWRVCVRREMDVPFRGVATYKLIAMKDGVKPAWFGWDPGMGKGLSRKPEGKQRQQNKERTIMISPNARLGNTLHRSWLGLPYG